MAKAVLRHPFRPGQVAGVDALSPLGLIVWIKAEYNGDRFFPARPVGLGVQQSQIGFQVLAIIRREHGALRWFV